MAKCDGTDNHQAVSAWGSAVDGVVLRCHDCGERFCQDAKHFTTHWPYRVEVQADRDDSWAGNGLRFTSLAAAEAYARDLWRRWFAVKAARVVNGNNDSDVHKVQL